jgi:hypothetical protein
MIGTTLELSRKFPVSAVLLLLIAVICFTVGFVLKNPHWAIFSILPGAVGLVLLITMPASFRADLTSSEICLQHTGENVPYTQISRLWYSDAGLASAAIHVFHQEGMIRIPRCDTADSDQVYDFLKSVLPPQGLPNVNHLLQPFLNSQSSTFGIDKVWAHNARPNVVEKVARRMSAVTLTALAVSFAWIMIGLSIEKVDWAAAGSSLLVVSVVVLLLLLVSNQRSPKQFGIKNWQASSLVISPVGLALVQGDLTGQLRWAEVHGLKFKNSSAPRQRRVELRVEGAQILIRDIYDTPLTEIHRQIEHYWQAG